MLAVDTLLKDARAASGLVDYGSMEFVAGLQVLAHSINTEAHLTADNEAHFRLELLRLLENRLRMQRDLVAHPEILDEEILAPVFITSLPRTGSTKLHRMMAASGDFHSMKFWQAYNFAPFSPGEPATPRITAAERYLTWMKRRAPLFATGHPMYTEETEEEQILLDAGFNSLYQHAAHLNVPSYIQFVLAQEPRHMFEDVRRILQYMQWQHFKGLQRRWILKTPCLLGTEGALASAFPGTDFVVTHRHPELVMASTAALFCGILQVFNESIDKLMAGTVMLANFGETVKRHLQWRAGYPADKVCDTRFDDIVKDELGVLSRLYEFLDMPFTDTARDNVRQWLAMDAARRESSPTFTLEEFGLEASTVNRAFAGYIERYHDYL
ncbi:MAG: sulfotransferase [Steroidobacteraceae bacterium]